MSIRCLSAALVLVLVGIAPAAAGQKPLPLDPLTAGERALADTIARVDTAVRAFSAGTQARRIAVDFIAPKEVGEGQRADAPPRRHAELLFYRYDSDQGLRVLVDLERRRVVQSVRIPGQSVPLAAEEVVAAARLALADRRVAALFGGRLPAFQIATRPATLAGRDSARVEGLRTVGATADDPCYRRRCVVLFFRVNNQYLHMNRVTVDLSSQRVIVR